MDTFERVAFHFAEESDAVDSYVHCYVRGTKDFFGSVGMCKLSRDIVTVDVV
jgi:hypothetical protein